MGGLWQALNGKAPTMDSTIVWRLRLPWAAAAFSVDALLSWCGALFQVLLRNPLVDPYVFGNSGGAAVAALISMLLGRDSAWLGINAFIGSLASMAVVFGLSHLRVPWTQTRRSLPER